MNRNDRRRKQAAQRKLNVDVEPTSSQSVTADPLYDSIRSSATLTKIKSFARTDDVEGLGESYDWLAGCGGMDVLLSGNLVERAGARLAIGAPMRKIVRQPNVEIAVQMDPVQLAPGSAAVLDLGRARAGAKVFKKTGVGSISAINLYGYPDITDPLRFGIAAVAWTVFYGENIRQSIESARARTRATPPDSALPKPTFEWLPPGKKAPLKEALDELFFPKSYSWAAAESKALELGIEDWKKASFARKRALVLFQAQSMIPMERIFFGYHDGEVVLKPILNAAQLRLKGRKAQKADIHRDGLVHFWWSELRRLSLGDLSVPLIKLR